MDPLLSGHVETETEEMESLEYPTSTLEGSLKHCCKTSLHGSQATAGQAKFVLLIKLPQQEHQADMGHGKRREAGASALGCQAGGWEASLLCRRGTLQKPSLEHRAQHSPARCPPAALLRLRGEPVGSCRSPGVKAPPWGLSLLSLNPCLLIWHP